MRYDDRMTVPIGPHTVELEGDIVIVRLKGEFTLAHMKEWCALTDQLLKTQGHVFTISDFRGGGYFPADARRYASEWSNTTKVWGSAIFGAGTTARVIISMMARVTALLKKHTIPTVAVESEEAARAWIDARRQQLLKE